MILKETTTLVLPGFRSQSWQKPWQSAAAPGLGAGRRWPSRSCDSSGYSSSGLSRTPSMFFGSHSGRSPVHRQVGTLRNSGRRALSKMRSSTPSMRTKASHLDWTLPAANPAEIRRAVRPPSQRTAVPMAVGTWLVPPGASATPGRSAAIRVPRHRGAPVVNWTPTAGSSAILRPVGPSSASTPARRSGSRPEHAWLPRPR